jgi:hypothetical protein
MQQKAKKHLKWEREDKQIKEYRAKAPYLKSFLRGRGCVLPFYDFLDSYEDEFHRIADAAKAEHPSLLGVHEVDDQSYFEDVLNWSKLGYGHLNQVFFDIEDSVPGYGRKGTDATMCGCMSTFLDADQNVRTVILIRQTVKIALQHREFKYAFKIASLLHEIGHVHDLENEINFDLSAKRLNLIEAEVFANLFCLEQLAKRCFVHSFRTVESALRDAISQVLTAVQNGGAGEVSRRFNLAAHMSAVL